MENTSDSDAREACFKCCTDPACEPHRKALTSKSLRTDWITRKAAAKRSSKVAPGAFYDSNIQYFGETVVIWDVSEFMEVPKWREEAMRRSRNRQDGNLDLDVTVVDGKKRRRTERVESVGVVVPVGKKEAGKISRKRISRKKRFNNICDELYQKSLSKK